MKKILYFFIISNLFFSSCNRKCTQFVEYQKNVINIKSLQSKLGSQNPINIGVGELLIDPKYRDASDRFKELDRIQYEICDQLNRIKDKNVKSQLQEKYVTTLMDMLKILQNPNDYNSLPKQSQNASIITNNQSGGINIVNNYGESQVILSDEYQLELMKFIQDRKLDIVVQPTSGCINSEKVANKIFQFLASRGYNVKTAIRWAANPETRYGVAKDIAKQRNMDGTENYFYQITVFNVE